MKTHSSHESSFCSALEQAAALHIVPSDSITVFSDEPIPRNARVLVSGHAQIPTSSDGSFFLCTGLRLTRSQAQTDALDLSFPQLTASEITWLRAHAPIGCADRISLQICRTFQIPAFFSGSLLLALPASENAASTGSVCAAGLLAEELFALQEKVGDRAPIVQSECPAPLSQASRQPFSADVLEKELALYRTSSCVVTGSLPCALACLALQTPVLLLRHESCLLDDDSGDLLHAAPSAEFVAGATAYDVLNPPENPRAYLALREPLLAQIAAWSSPSAAPSVQSASAAAAPDSSYAFRLLGEVEQLSALQHHTYQAQQTRVPLQEALAAQAENLFSHIEKADADAQTSFDRLSFPNAQSSAAPAALLQCHEELLQRSLTSIQNHVEAQYNTPAYQTYRVHACYAACKATHSLKARLHFLYSWLLYKLGKPARMDTYLAKLPDRLQLAPFFQDADTLAALDTATTQQIHQIAQDNRAQTQLLVSTLQDTLKMVHAQEDSETTCLRCENAYYSLLERIDAVRRAGRKVVCVFAPFFQSEERLRDGYYRRIKVIDDLMGPDTLRIYVSGDQYEWSVGKLQISPVDDTHVCVAYSMLLAEQNNMVLQIALRADFAYHHSVGYLNPLVANCPQIKKIFDLHGALPEEHLMRGQPYQAQIESTHEAMAMQCASSIVCVTQSMADHMAQKYPSSHPNVITLPILDPLILSARIPAAEKPLCDGRPVVVYAGGMQAWQKVDVMQETIFNTAQSFQYRIFTSTPDVFWDLWGMREKPSSLQVCSCSLSELQQEYAACHYGFVLRDDSVVNLVACPTKLIEYILQGIVPILSSPHIGDFVKSGMQYLSLEQFLSAELPSEAARAQMALHNQKILDALIEKYDNGRAILTHLLSDGE